jgi:hypothetical protein
MAILDLQDMALEPDAPQGGDHGGRHSWASRWCGVGSALSLLLCGLL